MSFYLLNIARLLGLYVFITLVCFSPFAYLLRDGLGPDASERSEGLEALGRTLDNLYYGWLLLGFLLLFVGTRTALKRAGYWPRVQSWNRYENYVLVPYVALLYYILSL